MDDIQERVARLNTQLRFGKHREALVEAYRLRIHLETCGREGPQVDKELASVEQVIEKLERRKSGRLQRALNMFLKAAIEAFDRSSGKLDERAGIAGETTQPRESERGPNV